MKISTYIDEEVERQGFVRGTREYGQRVYWMLAAWNYALDRQDEDIVVAHILEVGRLVEQEINANGFRRVGVSVGGRVCMPWRLIPRAIENVLRLVETVKLYPVDAEQFYYEYEYIHPFRDGNGRSGKVLYNWLKHTLDDPIMPPDFFGAGVP